MWDRPFIIVRSAVIWLLVSTVAGCTAMSPSPTDPHGFTTTTSLPFSTTTVTMEEGLDNYRNCLSDEGVLIPEIPVDGLGRPRMSTVVSALDLTDRAVLDALETCGRHLSSGALDSSADPALRELIQATLEEFAECVRAHGVADYPDPVADFDGVGSPFRDDRIPWEDPELQSAVASCAPTGGFPN